MFVRADMITDSACSVFMAALFLQHYIDYAKAHVHPRTAYGTMNCDPLNEGTGHALFLPDPMIDIS